ncbi:hypothetical protein GVAV_002245 [Gurleya vavrai]
MDLLIFTSIVKIFCSEYDWSECIKIFEDVDIYTHFGNLLFTNYQNAFEKSDENELKQARFNLKFYNSKNFLKEFILSKNNEEFKLASKSFYNLTKINAIQAKYKDYILDP